MYDNLIALYCFFVYIYFSRPLCILTIVEGGTGLVGRQPEAIDELDRLDSELKYVWNITNKTLIRVKMG